MKIRMLVGMAGSQYSLSPGDEREFPGNKAIRLIEAKFAVPVDTVVTERAVAQPVAERRARKGKPDVVSGESDGSSDGGAGNT